MTEAGILPALQNKMLICYKTVVEGIGTGGYGFDHTGDYWNTGEYLTYVKHFEGRFHKSEGGGSFTNFDTIICARKTRKAESFFC